MFNQGSQVNKGFMSDPAPNHTWIPFFLGDDASNKHLVWYQTVQGENSTYVWVNKVSMDIWLNQSYVHDFTKESLESSS